MQRYPNTVAFEVTGKYALFSDPVTRVGGEKCSYQIPTYDAIRGVCESIYWKPTIIWVVDEVRIMNQIRSEAKGIRTLGYSDNKPGLSFYTYLKDVCYQVKAHFEWNMKRPDLADDRNENKHYRTALRKIEEGGKRDIFLGTRECQAYVCPAEFGSSNSYYDNSGTIPFGLMYHGIVYPDKTDDGNMLINFFQASMTNGIIRYPRPDECTFVKTVNCKEVK